MPVQANEEISGREWATEKLREQNQGKGKIIRKYKTKTNIQMPRAHMIQNKNRLDNKIKPKVK